MDDCCSNSQMGCRNNNISRSHTQPFRNWPTSQSLLTSQSWFHAAKYRSKFVKAEGVTDHYGMLNGGGGLLSVPYSASRRFFFRTAHMEAASSVDVATPTTTVERLAKASPKIIIADKEIKDYLENEAGAERVRKMFKIVRTDCSDDLSLIMSTTTNTGFAVFLVMSIFGGYAARDKFLEKNKHKTYTTRFLALRAYHDTVIFGSLRLGLKWGFKAAFFTALFMTTSQVIAVYRNKSSVMEYVVAGGFTCGLLRMSVGLRGMFAGAAIGSALGLVGGSILVAMMYASSTTQQQRRYSAVEQILREKREIELLQPESAQPLRTGISDSLPM